ncbi:hypothetical protein [Microvirga sp. TS319]|uniref:hypothetical protein n=1 Tax=Microvirga sp. TS319 TaxID=3241165 RepID=UPI00351A8F84
MLFQLYLFLTDLPDAVYVAAFVLAIVAAFTARRRLSGKVLLIGVLTVVAAWIPLLLIGATGLGGSNPVGLGLLAWIGSGLGLVVIVVGLVLRVWELIKPV